MAMFCSFSLNHSSKKLCHTTNLPRGIVHRPNLLSKWFYYTSTNLLPTRRSLEFRYWGKLFWRPKTFSCRVAFYVLYSSERWGQTWHNFLECPRTLGRKTHLTDWKDFRYEIRWLKKNTPPKNGNSKKITFNCCCITDHHSYCIDHHRRRCSFSSWKQMSLEVHGKREVCRHSDDLQTAFS